MSALVLAIFLFGYNTMVRRQNIRAHHEQIGEVAATLAVAGANLLAEQIQSAEVTVSAEFAQTSATVADLLRLKPGDFIALDLKQSAIVRVDDVPFFECRYGISNKRYAVRIQSFLTARHEADPGDSQS